MAGWTFCPINRTLAQSSAELTIVTGTAVTGYPIVNLTDPVHWNQTRITPDTGVVRIGALFSSALSTSDIDYRVNCFGLVNHNLDGCTIEIRHHSSNSYGAATAISGTPFTLTGTSGNPDLLFKFTDTTNLYWWINISGAPTPVSIGQLVLGYAFDIGHPLQGEQHDPVPLHEPYITAGGYEVPTRLMEPAVTKVVTFRAPDNLGSSAIYDRTRDSGSSYYSYQTMQRAFETLRTTDVGQSFYSGVSAAGGAVPILYHMGSTNGISTVGRPAHYGYCRPRFIRHELRGTISTVVMTIRDANPRATDIQPAI